jgi:hypothetical protein
MERAPRQMQAGPVPERDSGYLPKVQLQWPVIFASEISFRDPMKIIGNDAELLISELRVGLDCLKQLSLTAFAEVRGRERSAAWHRRFSKCPNVPAACRLELVQGQPRFHLDGVRIPSSPLMGGKDSWQAEKPFRLPYPLRVNAANDDSKVPLGLLFQTLLYSRLTQ